MDLLTSAPERLKSFRETRLSALRPFTEFFDHHRISRPADMNQATSRISYNTRYFSGNYGLVVAILAVYALITNPLLLIALGLLTGGFIVINRWAPEPMQVGDHVVTQKSLYIGLFVIGLPLLWWASPVSTFFWLVGSSVFLILFHAALLEPGVESEYTSVQDSV
ncbi:prenylated rab acceptor PRA1 [Gautieria morchelliformis]|nr:prenylated rab acceptor PRA1 [Gautieria morchelliformis]